MKGLFLSLTRSQMKQMKAMQSIQAETEKLKKQYKNDPQGLNKATMDLYSKRGINPLSGCLPMVVQLPVFWALYAVLRNSIELRGAHFVFWLTDLSQPDTLFGHLPTWLPLVSGAAIGLLPILMGVSFIAQTLLTSTDKRNMAMTLIFPVFITFIFLNMPSGLQLYWFMYNVLSLIESKMDDLRVAGYFVLSHLTYPIFLVWARTTGKNRLRRGSVRATFRAGSVRPYVALLYWEQRVKAVLFPERMSMRDRLQRVRETRGRKSGFLGRLGRGLVLLFFGRELKSRQAAGRRRAEPTLVPDDLSRPAALVARLRRPETPLLEHIRSSLTENLRRAIDDHKPGPIPAELRTRLATELNTILESGPLYQPERFARVVLAADTRRLLRQPTGDDLARLNRWLLEDACPQVANSRTSPLAQYRLVTESVKHGATGARLRVRHRRPAAASEAPAPPPQTGDGKPGSP
jgi:YidC/Oxa1 family membrane protein insertase